VQTQVNQPITAISHAGRSCFCSQKGSILFPRRS